MRTDRASAGFIQDGVSYSHTPAVYGVSLSSLDGALVYFIFSQKKIRSVIQSKTYVCEDRSSCNGILCQARRSPISGIPLMNRVDAGVDLCRAWIFYCREEKPTSAATTSGVHCVV